MTSGENKRKHLEIIQGVINRMSGSLFYLKGWAISLIVALFALSAKETNQDYIYVAYFPVIIFWILDGYFLSHERAFRDLYNEVRAKDETSIDYSMDVKKFQTKSRNKWVCAMFSKTLLIFYVALVVVMLLIMYLLKYHG